MKVLTIIISCFIFLTNGKLVEKVTQKNYATKVTESSTPIRISRQAFYDDGLGTSIEEYNRNYVRKERYSIKTDKYNDEVPSKTVRVSRDSSENRTEARKQTVVVPIARPKTTKVLIKKPIPKFNETDEEDFQMKVSKSPIKVADSGEHEDEDFNLDDYEFDVNHDEFASRGKPLEPRAKVKSKDLTEKKISKKSKRTTRRPEIKIQSKVVIPASSPSYVKRNAMSNKAADKMKEDYYDDVTTTNKPETGSKRELDEEFGDDSESGEYNQKTSIRTVRSPWSVKLLADRMGSRGAKLLSNVLAYLPLFPEPPNSSEDVIDVPNMDPNTGREFMF